MNLTAKVKELSHVVKQIYGVQFLNNYILDTREDKSRNSTIMAFTDEFQILMRLK